MSREDIKKLGLLEKEAKTLRQKIEDEQERCFHEWGASEYEPFQKTQGYGIKLVGRGSDPSTEYEVYKEVTVDRWSRTCLKCGKVQYADKRKTKVVDEGPDFS